MALQTSHSTEPSPTSSAASTQTVSSNPASQTSPFSAAGSPPLILAFLAIGLFSAAMVITFGWRRIQYARGLIPHSLTFHDENMSPRVPLVRPRLWDLWNGEEVSWAQVSGSEKGRRDSELQWSNIMPLSANAVPTTAIPESIASIQSSTELASTLARRRDLLDRQPPALRMWRQIRERKTRNKTTSPNIPPPPPPPKLQVEVAILMPSPRHPVYVRDEKGNEYRGEKRKERDDLTEFSIGVYQCTWD